MTPNLKRTLNEPEQQLQAWLRGAGIAVPLEELHRNELMAVNGMLHLRMRDLLWQKEKIEAAMSMLECDTCGETTFFGEGLA